MYVCVIFWHQNIIISFDLCYDKINTMHTEIKLAYQSSF